MRSPGRSTFAASREGGRSIDRVASHARGAAQPAGACRTGRADATDAGSLAAALAAFAMEVCRENPLGGAWSPWTRCRPRAVPPRRCSRRCFIGSTWTTLRLLFAGTGLPHTLQVLLAAGVTHREQLFLVEQIPLALAHKDAR